MLLPRSNYIHDVYPLDRAIELYGPTKNLRNF